jgi:hypothetical protein
MDLGGHMADPTRNLPDVAASESIHGRRTDEWVPVSRVRTYELVLECIRDTDRHRRTARRRTTVARARARGAARGEPPGRAGSTARP